MMSGINDLPEDVLVQVLPHVPGKDLIHCCRLVCSHWKDVVDLPTLWKRKCEIEGFSIKRNILNPEDWRNVYFLFKKKKNLIKNPCAGAQMVLQEVKQTAQCISADKCIPAKRSLRYCQPDLKAYHEKLKYWHIDDDIMGAWAIEELPGDHGQGFPQPNVKKYFVTSFRDAYKSQLIDLKEEGYWEKLMDEVQPDIMVTDWYAARHDCGCWYELCVQLLSADYIVLKEFKSERVLIEQWSDAKWRQMFHTFRSYGPGVRYIHFRHGGCDTQFWAGWYGVRVTNSSLVIQPPEGEEQ